MKESIEISVGKKKKQEGRKPESRKHSRIHSSKKRRISVDSEGKPLTNTRRLNDDTKEERRRKIIQELKMESNTKEDKDKEEENLENDEINDKGTYISNNIKNKLTISIKPKSKLIKQISSSSLEDKGEEKIKEKEENEKIPNKNKKANALINILKKLQKKKI